MNDNTSLFNQIRNMRHARRLGKLSADQQRQTLLALGYRPVVIRHNLANGVPCESSARWEIMMALRQSIEIEITPVLQKRRDAEEEAFQCRQDVESRFRRVSVKENPVLTAKVEAPVVPGLDENWWKANKSPRSKRPVNK